MHMHTTWPSRFADARRRGVPEAERTGPKDLCQLLDNLSEGGSEDDSLDDFLKGEAAWKTK